MWYALYNVLLVLSSPIIFCILAAKRRCRRGLPERLGLERAGVLHVPSGPEPMIWIHAVSLGEVVAAVPLARELRQRYPGYRLIVSTVTETGREAVEQRLAGVAEHRYAPLDFPWAVSRFIRRWKPTLYLFVETELWPNVLRTLQRNGIPSILVNGRLSTRSYERQHLGPVRHFYRTMLRTVSMCLMQSDRDVHRIVELGADPARVRRTGNIKFDQPLPQPAAHEGVLSRPLLGLAEDQPMILAGSTHPEEEEQLLACYRRLVQKFPSLLLILAPRHIERAVQVEAMVHGSGIPVARRSTIGAGSAPARGPRVIILDSRGELALLYREATVAFVGGTLVPIGGHNLLEPAVWGKPILFGPYTDHCAEVARLLIEANGGCRVRDVEELTGELGRLLDNSSRIREMGAAARQVVLENQGALQRSLDIIAGFLPGPERSVPPTAERLTCGLSGSRS
jgi:3-deoxy-D-manno-octulosonic-acid transferase